MATSEWLELLKTATVFDEQWMSYVKGLEKELKAGNPQVLDQLSAPNRVYPIIQLQMIFAQLFKEMFDISYALELLCNNRHGNTALVEYIKDLPKISAKHVYDEDGICQCRICQETVKQAEQDLEVIFQKALLNKK